MTDGLKTLPRGFAGSAGDRSAERQDFVDELRVGEDHPTAAVPFQPELVEDLPGLLSTARSLDERGERTPDDLAARETSDGDDHWLTGTTSAAFSAPRDPAASSAACAGYPGRSTCDRIRGRRSPDRCHSDIERGRGRSPCGPRPPAPSRRRLERSRRCRSCRLSSPRASTTPGYSAALTRTDRSRPARC